MDCPHGQSLARPAARVRQVEHGVPTVSRLGKSRCFCADFRGAVGGAGHGIRLCSCHDHQGSPARSRRKRGTQNQAIGKSKGGWTTKIVALTDALGNLVRFVLLPRNRHDTIGVAPLIDGAGFDALLGDKAFDANRKARKSTSAEQRSSSRSGRSGSVPSPSIWKCTSGDI